MNRYDAFVTRTTHAVLDASGAIEPKTRWAIFHRRLEDVPAALAGYVAKVRDEAWKITDEDVAALRGAGYSEDAIFEATASAALGAALARLERGLIASHDATR